MSNTYEAFTPIIRYSMALAKENWCIDYAVFPPADANYHNAINYRAMNYRESSADLMRTAYPGITKQNQSCEQLGYTAALPASTKDFKQSMQASGKAEYTFTATGTNLEGKGAIVNNSFWTKPTAMVMLI